MLFVLKDCFLLAINYFDVNYLFMNNMRNSIMSIKSIVLFFALFVSSLNALFAQTTIEISGSCVSGTVVLSESDLNDEKLSYTGVGSAFGYDDTQFAIWWDATELKWLLGLDGQPYWYSSDDTTKPNSTLLKGYWTQTEFSEGTCDVEIQGTGTNMPLVTSVAKDGIQGVHIYSQENTIYVNLANAEEVSITLCDISGRTVKNLLSNGQNSIRISNLRKGGYILKMSSGSGTMSEKVFVR